MQLVTVQECLTFFFSIAVIIYLWIQCPLRGGRPHDATVEAWKAGNGHDPRYILKATPEIHVRSVMLPPRGDDSRVEVSNVSRQ